MENDKAELNKTIDKFRDKVNKMNRTLEEANRRIEKIKETSQDAQAVGEMYQKLQFYTTQ